MIVGTINEIIIFLEKAQATGMTTLAELIEYLQKERDNVSRKSI